MRSGFVLVHAIRVEQVEEKLGHVRHDVAVAIAIGGGVGGRAGGRRRANRGGGRRLRCCGVVLRRRGKCDFLEIGLRLSLRLIEPTNEHENPI